MTTAIEPFTTYATVPPPSKPAAASPLASLRTAAAGFSLWLRQRRKEPVRIQLEPVEQCSG